MCRSSDALALRVAAQDALSAACMARVQTPIAAVLERVGQIEQANPGWATALLDRIDEKDRG